MGMNSEYPKSLSELSPDELNELAGRVVSGSVYLTEAELDELAKIAAKSGQGSNDGQG